MAITIIKVLNKNIFNLFLFSFSFLFFSCASQKRKTTTPNNQCKLFEDNLNRVSFSENKNDLSNLELAQFYDDENDFDIIIYNHLEGSNNYNLKRFYKNKSGVWKNVTIIDGNRNDSNPVFNDIEIIDYLNKVEEKALYQYCGTCFDCRYYTFLIKKSKSIFKYYSNGEVFSEIDKTEKEKLFNYINIYNFFIKK